MHMKLASVPVDDQDKALHFYTAVSLLSRHLSWFR
jgi:hypothetical protein